LGLGWRDWQFGLASNSSLIPAQTQVFSANLGGFLRHEF
jgi:hypothetical protein